VPFGEFESRVIAKVAEAAGIERDTRVGRTFLSDVFTLDSC